MNRYNRGPGSIGGPSKATASTTCQKCLKKDSYECKAVAQERPYVSRPSRTQQLLNPKLVPKLTSDISQDPLRKKGVADEQLARMESERGRKRDRADEATADRGSSKRMRSASSASVSTISTGASRSPSPSPGLDGGKDAKSRSHHSPPSHPQAQPVSVERKRRRQSVSSADSYSANDKEVYRRSSRERTSSRSTRRRFEEHSPPARGRPSNGRKRSATPEAARPSNGRPAPGAQHRQDNVRPRERSLSPFSKRLALTQSMNTAR